MVFRDNIVYKNDNTISKNHLIFISNIPFDNSSIFGIISKVKGKVELTKENVYVTIKTMKFFNKACI